MSFKTKNQKKHHTKNQKHKILFKLAKVNYPKAYVLFEKLFVGLKRGKPQPEVFYSNSDLDSPDNYKDGFFVFDLNQNVYESSNNIGDYSQKNKGCFDVILSTKNQAHITFKFRPKNGIFVKMYLHKFGKTYIITKPHLVYFLRIIKRALEVRSMKYIKINDKKLKWFKRSS